MSSLFPFDRLHEHPAVVAPLLLGAVLRRTDELGTVAVRLTEVEAYGGVGEDPGAHCYRGLTPRNRALFGEPGQLYVYFSYGMHVMLNVVCHSPGHAGGILLRSGQLVEGIEIARSHRPAVKDRDLAAGPGRLARAIGATLADYAAPLNGEELPGSHVRYELLDAESHALPYTAVPRKGIAGPGGGPDFPWRFIADLSSLDVNASSTARPDPNER